MKRTAEAQCLPLGQALRHRHGRTISLYQARLANLTMLGLRLAKAGGLL